MQKSIFFKVIGFLALFLILIIGYSPGQIKAESNVLKIGVVQPLSGAAAFLAIPMLKSAEMAAEDINNRGGVKVAGKKYTIKIVSADDGYTSAGGVAAFNRLILKKGVKFIIGSL
ncbi:MAG: branched-chain amino acid transport system substrate-binding protein, partial [bacterium]